MQHRKKSLFFDLAPEKKKSKITPQNDIYYTIETCFGGGGEKRKRLTQSPLSSSLIHNGTGLIRSTSKERLGSVGRTAACLDEEKNDSNHEGTHHGGNDEREELVYEFHFSLVLLSDGDLFLLGGDLLLLALATSHLDFSVCSSKKNSKGHEIVLLLGDVSPPFVGGPALTSFFCFEYLYILSSLESQGARSGRLGRLAGTGEFRQLLDVEDNEVLR
jgi:hypothetical protein